MSDLRNWSRQLCRESRTLPGIVAQRCVHMLLATASCQACVDVCPRDAWVLEEEQLGIDSDRCDGCNLCVAACPQGAVQAEVSPELKRRDNQLLAMLAMLACEPSGIQADTGVIPCLHAVSLNMLMALYRQEIGEIVVCCANCDTCPRGGAAPIEVLVEHFNTMLSDRDLPEIRYQSVPPGEWTAMHDRLDSMTTGGSISRRQFFRRTTQAVVEGKSQLGVADGSATERFLPAGQMLPRQSQTQMVPFLPQIEPTRCNACNACLKLCPHDAITFDKNATSYCIEPDRCSGCGICGDACDQDAVAIQTWSIPRLTRIPLAATRCDACGAPYFMPTAHASSGQLCRICAQRRHHQKLYQVLD